MTHKQVADILLRLAEEIETAPVQLVGASVSVTGGQGGSVTGLRITAQAGPEGTETIGMKISVDPAAYASKASDLVSDLREAAAAANDSMPARGWIISLIDRAKGLGNRALDSAVGTAAAELVKALG